MSSSRELDLIVFGAASFVGRLLTRYLMQRHGAEGELKWALAGRNQAKLDAVAEEFGAGSLPTLIADAGSADDMRALASRTQVVVSTVGPYALYGSELVAACAAAGTDYCDLTGEPQWMQRMIDAHETTAQQSGARIVHNCGFDSIPSDLGVWFLQREAEASLGAPCTRVGLRVKAMRGGASGGTVASLLNVMEEAKRDPGVIRAMKNPYACCPPDQRSGPRQQSHGRPGYDEDAGSWLGPFVMAGINTKVVHRSNALRGRPWGQDFVYDEAMMTGAGAAGMARAGALAGGLGGFMALAAIGPTRRLLAARVLPKPGEGPTPEAQEKGFWDMRLFGTTADGGKIAVKVTGDRDPGYASTAKMLGEAAVCLLQDRDATNTAGGFPTPSVAMNGALLDRLIAHAGLRFEVTR